MPNRRLSTRTVRNRLKSAGLKSRRVIKRPLLEDRYRRTNGTQSSQREPVSASCNGGRMRVWRHKIQPIPQGTPIQLSLTVEAQ